ncbi:hypothetical protein H7U19_10985 [Hyunsoonleella sp. SJ7]|uniref:Outer membrane lipoprotein-sorting protein n=1 Tax=Hyunsoonleella aquatilis TaxID=2762758 RepID=A0A923KKX1_9FLAO|nr:hypothetical protein [Hyunsoonleella aquatilis]MBC3758932.1 hypothetical protein [Hyunsoonleella aquatilis]
MNRNLKFSFAISLITLLFLGHSNINAQVYADEKSKSLIDAMVEVNGGYQKLASKKDIQFKYVYDNYDAGKDVSLERHIINGEHSWAQYDVHQRNVLPKQKGVAQQALVDGKPMLTLDGKPITDEKALGGTVFLRKVNFYWFTMMYKLQDPGTNYKYLGTEEANGITYDKVSLTYDADITKKEKNDEYILYFNPETHLVDWFYFSLPDWGINDPILKMTLQYEIVDGLHISTVRKSFVPNEKGEYHDNGTYTFSEIKFNNGFKKEGFILK